MTKKRKGFTIIEVVLVLAIGGLVFLMVFVALPAFQRSQRNTQRRNDLDRVLAAFTEYQKHNSGRLPDGDEGGERLISRYIDSEAEYGESYAYSLTTPISCSDAFMDPDGECYNLYICPWGNWVDKRLRGAYCNTQHDLEAAASGNSYMPNHTILVYYKTRCGKEEGESEYVDKSNRFAIYYILEGGQIHCIDNS